VRENNWDDGNDLDFVWENPIEPTSPSTFSVESFPLTRKPGRPRKEVSAQDAANIYRRAQEILRDLGTFRPEDWRALLEARNGTATDVFEALKRIPVGHRVAGGLGPNDPNSFSAMICASLKERDFPKLNAKKQQRHIAFSIAAEGRVGIRKSRAICRQQERAANSGRPLALIV
jgi:hypothetical protein